MIVKFNGEVNNFKHRFVDVADEWAAEAFPKLAYRTLSSYTAGLKHAKLYFQEEYIEDITHQKINNYIEVGSEKVYLYRFYPPNLSILTKKEKDIEIKKLSDFLDAANIPIQMFGLDKVEDLSKNIEFFSAMSEQYKEYTQQIVNELTDQESNGDGTHSVQRAYYFIIKVKTDGEVSNFEDALNSQNLSYSKASKGELTTVLRNFFLREFSPLDLFSFDKEVLEKYESNTSKRTKKA